ncbi:MAG: hypothetical protein LQ345_001662 [Seirophora villosa]|nr:MAG: hypothetical protein LQ345_001662 [Seirophora villosa]
MPPSTTCSSSPFNGHLADSDRLSRVVGGGTAGLAIASRLAANRETSVAVVEAGSFYQLDNGNGSVIPALAPLQHVGSLPNDTQPLIDWGFVTVSQAGANNRRMHYARGKTLGGSSALNYLAFHRQVPQKAGWSVGSYEQWAEQVGDDSYLFDNFESYFQRSATLTEPNLAKRYPTNGTVEFDATSFNNAIGGPLQVSWANWASPIGSWGQVALASAGIPPINGFNSGKLLGSAWVSQSLNPVNQHRSSSQTSYLDEAINTTSIVVYTRTQASKILFDANNTATGVSVQTAGLPYTLHARREVILSAGVFQSPQLLMLSGIGPRETLENHNIPVLADLPGVGQNLWDHVYYGVSFRVKVDTSSRLSNDPIYAAQAAENYTSTQTGPLTAVGAFIGFEKLPASYRQNLSASARERLDSAFPNDWPEIEYLIESAFDGYNTNYTAVDPNDGYQYATISSALVAPLSRGNVTISTADPSQPPVINPNWLTDPTDVELAILAFKRVREIWGYMNGTTIGEEYFPGTAEVATDEEILSFIRQALVQLWHAAGTCKMGKAGDEKEGGDGMAVVDPEGRVYGVKGLRVVDASVFPLLPPGHPQATIYALAEKIADAILSGK